jgi:hypothetical protein
MSGRDILRRLLDLGARLECRDGHLKLHAGKRPVPEPLIEQVRAAKNELLAMLGSKLAKDHHLDRPFSLTTLEGECLRPPTLLRAAENPEFAEGAQVSTFSEHLRQKNERFREQVDTFDAGSERLPQQVSAFAEDRRKALTEGAHLSIFIEPQHSCGGEASIAPKSLTCPAYSEEASFFDEHLRAEGQHTKPGPEVMEASAATPTSNVPLGWIHGLFRLDPNSSPGDVPKRYWQQFIIDARRLVKYGTVVQAAALGWTTLDLFGCDRTKPFARIDQAGLLWLLNGDRLIALTENTATIETRTGARQTFRRKPNEPDRVLAWELAE